MWSWVLSILGCSGMLLVSHGRRIGWLVCFTNECLWIVYALMTGQYGFILASGAYMVVHVGAWIRWGRLQKSAKNQPFSP